MGGGGAERERWEGEGETREGGRDGGREVEMGEGRKRWGEVEMERQGKGGIHRRREVEMGEGRKRWGGGGREGETREGKNT